VTVPPSVKAGRRLKHEESHTAHRGGFDLTFFFFFMPSSPLTYFVSESLLSGQQRAQRMRHTISRHR